MTCSSFRSIYLLLSLSSSFYSVKQRKRILRFKKWFELFITNIYKQIILIRAPFPERRRKRSLFMSKAKEIEKWRSPWKKETTNCLSQIHRELLYLDFVRAAYGRERKFFDALKPNSGLTVSIKFLEFFLSSNAAFARIYTVARLSSSTGAQHD